MDLRKDSIVLGIALGVVLPFIGYGLWLGVFELLSYFEIMDPTGFSESWRSRTIALLAICMNIIPFQMHQKLRNDQTMRGLIFPTVLFVITWVIVFRDAILGQG